jgi:serine/threonine-protein kinase HipA
LKNDDLSYCFEYDPNYEGAPISLTLPINQKVYLFKHFPPFFDGLLPEGMMLESLLKSAKLDRSDCFGQLIHVGKDLVGSVSVETE